MKLLPSTVYVNEDFTSPFIPDSQNENWGGFKACGAGGQCPGQHPSRWCDKLSFAVLPNTGTIPLPQAPFSPFEMVKMLHWAGKWSVGSPSPGQGSTVQTNVWQFYRDHANHLDVVSPP
jgi:hypothetical protein